MPKLNIDKSHIGIAILIFTQAVITALLHEDNPLSWKSVGAAVLSVLVGGGALFAKTPLKASSETPIPIPIPIPVEPPNSVSISEKKDE